MGSFQIVAAIFAPRTVTFFPVRAQRRGVLRLSRLPAQVGGQRLRRWHPAALVPRRRAGRGEIKHI